VIICQLIVHLLALIFLNTCTSKFCAICFSAFDVTLGWAALSEAAALLMPIRTIVFKLPDAGVGTILSTMAWRMCGKEWSCLILTFPRGYFNDK
jgi:hypothetical protein